MVNKEVKKKIQIVIYYHGKLLQKISEFVIIDNVMRNACSKYGEGILTLVIFVTNNVL